MITLWWRVHVQIPAAVETPPVCSSRAGWLIKICTAAVAGHMQKPHYIAASQQFNGLTRGLFNEASGANESPIRPAALPHLQRPSHFHTRPLRPLPVCTVFSLHKVPPRVRTRTGLVKMRIRFNAYSTFSWHIPHIRLINCWYSHGGTAFHGRPFLD